MATTTWNSWARIGWASLSAAATFVFNVANASAAPVFSEAASFVVGVEDITGYYSRTVKFDNEQNVEVERSRNRLALGLMTGGVRFGLHYFVIPHLSLGGSLGFESAPGSNSGRDGNGYYSEDVPTESRLIIAPRVGYALMFIPQVGIWFRGGIGYERDKYRLNEGTVDYARDSFGVASADIFFVWSPVPHFGLLIGPTGDLTFMGSHFEHHNPNAGGNLTSDASMHRLALTSGLFGYF